MAFGARTAPVRPLPSFISLEDSRFDAPFRVDWLLVDLACQAYNKVTVALYDTLGAESVGEYYASTRFSDASNSSIRIRVSLFIVHAVNILTLDHPASTTLTFR